MLFALLLVPIGFAGWVVGRYTKIGESSKVVVHTVTVGGAASTPTSTSAATTTSAGTTTSAATTTSPGGGGNAAAGKSVFSANGCAACHTFQPAGSTGTIGPNLDTAPTQDAKADGNMDLAAFVKQSITDPNAYIAKGFPKPSAMPGTFGSSLSPTQLNDLVAFIVSGAKS